MTATIASSQGTGTSPPSSAWLTNLEPFVLLAKTARGAAAARLVLQATEAPGCYVFSELADTQGIKELARDPSHAKTIALLQLFSFGTISKYLEQTQNYPALTQTHLDKLRQLSLVTLASQSRVLQYADILEALKLDVHVASDGSLRHDGLAGSSSHVGLGDGRKVLDAASVRLLEDVIIESIYSGLLSGRLDQKRGRFHVDGVMGRDVDGEEELKKMEAQLFEWNNTTTTLLSHLSGHIEAIKEQALQDHRAREQQDATLTQAMKAFGSLHGSWPAAMSWGLGDDMDVDDGPSMALRSSNKKKNKRTRT